MASLIKLKKIQKESKKNMMPAILQHYQTLTQPTSGAVQFSLYRTLATKDEADGGSLRFAANILDDNGESKDFGTISLGTTSINSDANNGYDYGDSIQDGRQYFGTIQNISVGNIISNEPLYIPGEIYITNFDQTPGNRPTIQVGTTIEWNEDNKNDLGVLVVVEFLAIDNLGQDIEDIKDVKLVDDGSFKFTSDFLSKYSK